MSIRIGIIGAGRVAQEHARGAKDAGSQLVCVYDSDRAKAQRFAEQHPGVCVADSLNALLEREDVQAAVIAVPNAEHCRTAVACLQAGKDVLLEKPMAMNTDECDRIIAAMRANDRLVQIGFVCRGAPKALAVQQIVASGALGTIYHARASICRQRGIPGLGRWFTTKAIAGGGVLIDLGVHLIDLVMYLAGAKRARTVAGVCESRFGRAMQDYVFTDMWAGPPDYDGVCDVEDSVTALIRFDTPLTLELNVAWAANIPADAMPEGILLLGDRGGVFFDLWGDRLTLTTERDGTVADTCPDVDCSDSWNRAWRWQHERFAEHVSSRTQPEASAWQGRAVQAIVDAIYRSSEEGREQVTLRD